MEGEPVGLLSQTLSPSSTVRWILPARVRTKWQNDVVFVGENFVQLREALPNGRLADVTVKLPLLTAILAAKVISAKLELVPIVEQILNQAREDERERYVINGQEIDDETPPQLVVLTLATNELVFLYAKDVEGGKTRFLHARKPVIRNVSLSERFGSHIAVDPESRAVAVAPAMGCLGIFALKHVDEIQGEIREVNMNASHIFKPSKQDRYLQIDGIVLKMEFLPSTTLDSNKLVLLVLVAHHGNTSMLLYRWDNREGPKAARPMMCSGQRLPLEDSLPLMLIPSSRCPSFVIVAETHLAVYDNVFTEMAKRVYFPCRREASGTYESSSVPPLWVQWAKPRRHAKHLEKHDDFYLVREDGELRYYVINHESPMKVDAHYSPGSLDVSVDQAFAIVAAPAELGADVFLAGGDLSDGGVWHCVARQTPVCVQILPNMAPMRDMLITGRNDWLVNGQHPGHTLPQRAFTCSGKDSKFSFVNEIRFGLEAEIVCSIEHEDAFSVTTLWILQDMRPERVLFLMSHPLHSSIVCLDSTTLEVEVGDNTMYSGFAFESPTLAAACTMEGLTIQLTRDSINLLSHDFRTASMPHLAVTCTAAAIEATTGYFIVANRAPNSFHLRLGVASVNMEIVLGSQQYDLPEEPTALTILLLRDVHHVILAGLSDGTLLVLHADATHNLHLLSSYYLPDVVTEAQTCTISSVEVLSRPQALQSLVLCGLRTGLLVLLSMSLDLDTGNGKPTISYVDKFELGHTRVGIVREQQMSSIQRGALISCETDLRRISLLDEVGLQYEISQIWMTSHENASTSQPILNAVSRVLDHPDADINGLLVYVSGSEILISTLVMDNTTVLRRHRIRGPPEKMIYSSHLKKLIVALNMVDLVSHVRNDKKPSMKRRFLPTLELVDPDTDSVSSTKMDDSTLLRFGENGDRIRALSEWRPAHKTAHFSFIVIGIDSDTPDYKLPTGRLLIVNVGNTRKMPFNALKVTVGTRYPGRPVYSLHPYGRSSLLVGAGNDIVLENFDMETRELSSLATFTLPSSATSLYESNLLVYASTLHHSLITLRKSGATFEHVAMDTIARNVRSALILDGDFNLLNTISGEGTCLIGMAKNYEDRQQAILFDARIPLVLESIKQSNDPNDYRQTFDSITMDGTLHRFKVLQHNEWKLIKFLESLLHDDRIPDLQHLDPFLKKKKQRQQQESVPRPMDMHVNGDLLMPFLEEGPSALRALLVRGKSGGYVEQNPDVKTEEQKDRGEDFINLAVVVVGESEDLVADVVGYLRALLRMTR